MTPKSLIEPARHAGTALLRSQTDARLVDLTRDGNERAFEAIVHRYHRPLLRYCSRMLSPTRAEDAVQQAFLSAHRSIHAGGAELNLRPWLYRIAHNAALNLLRQNGFDHEQVSEEIDGVETPPQIVERSERLRAVMAAVKDLPERQRDAIVLQAMEGRSYEEIAAELGVSDGAVRQLLNRARNTLREAAAALTPTGLITRVASSGGDVSVAERVTQAVSGAGGGALLVKAGAALVIAGAVTGGAVTGTLPVPGGGKDGPAKASADPLRAAGGGSGSSAHPGRAARVLTMSGGSGTVAGSRPAGQGARRSGSRATGGATGGHSNGPSAGSGGGGRSGPSSSGGGGSNSGSGSSGSGDGGGSRSGSDGGGDHSGSTSGDGGSSGSGSSGSTSSGSGDGGGTSGSDGGGSGDGSSSGSGSGSGSSGSGSGSGETLLSSPSTSGSDGSGSGDSGSSSDGHDGSGTSGSSH